MPLNKMGMRIEKQKKLAKKPRWLDRTKVNRQSFRSRSYRYNTLPGEITQLESLKKIKRPPSHTLCGVKTKPDPITTNQSKNYLPQLW